MVPYLRAANVKDGHLELDDVMSMDFSPKEQAEFALRRGDVLVTEGAGSLAAVGASAVWTAELPGVICFQNTLLRLRPTPGNDSRYLLWWARHAYASGLFAASAAGANIYHLGADTLRVLPVAIPPGVTQKRIANYLDIETTRLEAAIRARRRQLEQLTHRRRSVLDSLTVPRALGGAADAESARDWPVVPLKRAASFFTDGDWIESPFITTQGVRLIQTGNIGEGAYREQGFRYITDQTFNTLRCTEVLPGDILISRLASPVGCACIAPAHAEKMIASVDVVIMRPTAALDPAFAVAYLSSTYHLDLADLLSRGTTMQRLARSQVAALPMPLPPLEVQQRIAREVRRRLDDNLALSKTLQNQVALLEARQRALITAAVTGQIEIPRVAA